MNSVCTAARTLIINLLSNQNASLDLISMFYFFTRHMMLSLIQKLTGHKQLLQPCALIPLPLD